IATVSICSIRNGIPQIVQERYCMAHKWVYAFEEGGSGMRNLLGGKGANLAEMTSIGLPVPPGFTITTEACNAYYDANEQFPEGMWDQVLEHLDALGKKL